MKTRDLFFLFIRFDWDVGDVGVMFWMLGML